MKKGLWLCASLLSLLLAGCSMRTPEEMYTLPEQPAEYQNLNACIQETMAALGAEYAAPMSGENTQTVQLVDLDGDGIDEAVAFFRVTGDARPLKVYVFKRGSGDVYRSYSVIEGDGTAIYAISYENLGYTTAKEVIVSWRMSEKVHSLAAYAIRPGMADEWMRTGYSEYRVLDLDMDGQEEILVLQLDGVEGEHRVELYDHREGGMVHSADAAMSSEIKEITAMRTGRLKDRYPALFVSSAFGDGNGILTDIFAWREGELCNLTLDEDTGQSRSTVRYYDLVSGTDIDGDGVLEIPMPEAVPVYQKVNSPTALDFWVVNWQQYDMDGTPWPVASTYHNVQDRWYLELPEEWMGQLTLHRRDNAIYGERAVVFSRWRGEEEAPVPFLILYRLTGENRESRSQFGGRFLLATQSDALYAAEFLKGEWDCGLDEQGVRARFHLIKTDWSDGAWT